MDHIILPILKPEISRYYKSKQSLYVVLITLLLLLLLFTLLVVASGKVHLTPMVHDGIDLYHELM